MEYMIRIHGDYIQLDQALKRESIISSGGEMKSFLAAHDVKINGMHVTEKRKKLRSGDKLSIDGNIYRITSDKK